MRQYKITFDGVHVYIRHANSPEEARNFVPLKVVDNDFDNLVPLEFSVDTVEEMEISTFFQLNSQTEFSQLQEYAISRGLKAEKAAGSFMLLVYGYGGWMEEAWVKNYTVHGSNWTKKR